MEDPLSDGRTRADLLKLVGSAEQLASVERFIFAEGKAKGVEAIRFQTGGGLDGTILVDRALDLSDLRYMGRSLCWRSPAGVVAPSFYERPGNGWLRSFGGGMLVTCGLRNVGPGSQEGWETFGLHGEISASPASRVATSARWDGDRYRLEVKGEVREAYLGGPNLVLRRGWSTELGASWIELEDEVTNEGRRPELHMQLYHWNFGFPLLGPRSELHLTTDSVRPRDANAASQIHRWNRGEEPGGSDQVFYHRRRARKRGFESAVLVADRDRSDWGVELSWGAATLPHLVQWKSCGVAEYIMGIEPANCLVEGREAHRAAAVTPIAPGETRSYRLRLTVLDGRAALARAVAACRRFDTIAREPLLPPRSGKKAERPIKAKEMR